MIVDLLVNLPRYASLHPSMPKVIAYLQQADLLSLPIGKNIVDLEMFVLRDSYVTKPLADCFFEGHRIYADVQIVLKGEEIFGYCPKSLSDLRVMTPYSPEKEVEKYEPTISDGFRLIPGMFAIVFPEDIHLAKQMVDQPCPVEKAILKFLL